MPLLPPLTPRTAVVGVVGAAWLGATLGLVDHVLTAPDPVTYFSGVVADAPVAASGAAAGVPRLEHALTPVATDARRVLLVPLPAPSATAFPTASPTTSATAAPTPAAAARVAPPSPSASPTETPSAAPSLAATGSPDPSASPSPAGTGPAADNSAP